MAKFSDQLKRRIREMPESRQSLCRRACLDPAVMSRFMAGFSGLSIDTIDRLVEALGLELRPGEKEGG